MFIPLLSWVFFCRRLNISLYLFEEMKENVCQKFTIVHTETVELPH